MIKILLLCSLLTLSTASPASTILARETFSDFEAAGLRPGGGEGMLDSARWRVVGADAGDSSAGETIVSGNLARGHSNGGVRSGGLYAFSLAAEKRGLGVQATGNDFTPGALIWSLDNRTGEWLDNLILAFELWWLNDGARSTSIDTQISFDGNAWLALDRVRTPLAADALGWQFEPVVVSLVSPEHAQAAGARGLAPESAFWLRWQFDDAAGNGSRDELAITALEVSGTSAIMSLRAPGTLLCCALALGMAMTHARRTAPTQAILSNM